MFQVIYECEESWPIDQPLRIAFQAEIPVSPQLAERRANVYLGMHIGMALLAHEPVLFWGTKPVWRLPVSLCLRGAGKVGKLGSIDVDARSGQVIHLAEEQITEWQRCADDLVARSTPTTASTN